MGGSCDYHVTVWAGSCDCVGGSCDYHVTITHQAIAVEVYTVEPLNKDTLSFVDRLSSFRGDCLYSVYT